MKNLYLFFILLFSCLPLTVSAAPGIPTGLQVAGAVTKTAEYQPKDLRQHFGSSLQAITYTRRGVRHTAEAVSLWAVLQAAGPRVNPQIKNHLLQFVVLVIGRDGYMAAFSLAELSPDFGARNVWLALDEDGKPLGDDGSLALVVPEDKKAGRWVHAITKITVVDEAQAAASSGT